MRDIIESRLRQLKTERTQLAQQTEQAAAQVKQGRKVLAAYDGAIGELSALLSAVEPAALRLPEAQDVTEDEAE